MIRRIQLILAVAAAMTMSMVVATPAMADDIDHKCFPFCDNHRDFDRHDLFINVIDDFVEVEVDDCKIVGFDDNGDAIVVCELDVDF